MAIATVDTVAPVKRTRTRKAPVKAATPPAPPAPPAVEVTGSARPPIGTVISRVHVNLGGMIAFDAAMRGAVIDDKTATLSNLCQHEDGTVSPVQQVYTCPVCDRHGKSDEFVKGQAKHDGYVIVPDDIVNAADGADDEHKGKLTLTVHNAADVTHALPNGKVYYLAPNVNGTTSEHYATLARVMAERPDLAFVGIVAMRKIAQRYVLTSDGVTITCNQLADPALVRERPTAGVPANDATVAAMHKLMDVIVSPFDAALQPSKRGNAIVDYVATQDAAAAALPAGQTMSGDLTASLQAALKAAGVTDLADKRTAKRTRKGA